MSITKKTYEKIFGDPNKKILKKLQTKVDSINALEAEYEKLSDSEIKAKTSEFQERIKKGESLNDILPEAFATVREAAKRTLGMRHYDVQLIGGMVIHSGKIAEMRTGEGKTLVATLPTYLNALEGKGVHVVTVNDYLAKRDAVWMGQVYDFLGLSVGIIQGQRVTFIYDPDAKAEEETKEGSDTDEARDDLGSFKVQEEYLRPATRQEAYSCDITYGTNNEFGFDYLRDNMVQKLSDMVMREGNETHFAVIDEIDSILIDEARTPLIISAPAAEATEQYYQFATLAKQLTENTDYNLDEKLRSVTLTDEGIRKFEKALGIENLYVKGGIRIVHHIEQALRAEVLFKRDRDYVLEDNQVVIIDQFTGRKMPGRRYSEGLHQAIEAKEKVDIQRESQTLATITFQNFYRMYTKLSGMTGTAVTEEEEFQKIYNQDVIVIPTNKPDARIDHSDRIYKNARGKAKAIVKKIQECREKGQPILIGTISVEKNEELSEFLTSQGVDHEVLNAKNHEREGEIIAQAGRPGAVTLATNIAGRGVDIKLGGVPENKEDKEKVLKAGGLFVLGSERHESRRIDNQLRGRSARQGDPGETQFFVSTDDDLMRIFAGDRMRSVMERMNVPEDMPIEQRFITRMLESAQKKVEGHHFDIRKHVLEYDEVLNRQRAVIYGKRRQILDLSEGHKNDEFKSLREMMLHMIEQEIEFVVSYHTSESVESEDQDKQIWNVQEIYETMRTIFPITEKDKQFILSLKEPGKTKFARVEARDKLVVYLFDRAKEEYKQLEEAIKSQVQDEEEKEKLVQDVEKALLLRGIDTLWVEHLVSIDYLRTGIGLRGYGQRDPLIEYKKETYHMFNELLANIQKEIVYTIFKVGVGIKVAPSIMANDKMTLKGAQKSTSAQGSHIEKKARNKEGIKIGRNERVTITNGTDTKEMKYKKAQPLIESGAWKLV